MQSLRTLTIAAGIILGGVTAGAAAPVSFNISEENGGSAVDAGSLFFDSADPSAGTISFQRILTGDPDLAPPLFSAKTIGAISISLIAQDGALLIDASGNGQFTFADGTSSTGRLTASAVFDPYDATSATLDGFGSIGAQSTTGTAGSATGGGTLFGASFITPSTVPLPPAAGLFGSALLVLGAAGAGLRQHSRASQRA